MAGSRSMRLEQSTYRCDAEDFPQEAICENRQVPTRKAGRRNRTGTGDLSFLLDSGLSPISEVADCFTRWNCPVRPSRVVAVLRAIHLRSSSRESMPIAQGMTKSQTLLPIGAVSRM